MRRPIVVRYECGESVNDRQRLAIEHAFRALKLAAACADTRRIARECAESARDLVGAFGLRLEPRREISVARQEAILAEWQARHDARTVAS